MITNERITAGCQITDERFVTTRKGLRFRVREAEAHYAVLGNAWHVTRLRVRGLIVRQSGGDSKFERHVDYYPSVNWDSAPDWAKEWAATIHPALPPEAQSA